MLKILLSALFFASTALGQSAYEEYESYQTFTDIDKYQRDYGLVFLPAMMYTSVDENNSLDNGGSINSRGRDLFFYDVKLGYIFRGGFYFGLQYSGDAVDINGSQPKNTRESVGISFGYNRAGVALTGTFFPYSKQTLEGADAAQYSDGMGFQLDAAYYFRLGNYFSFGPQLTYKSIQYTEAESASTNVNFDANSTHGIFTPMLAIMINLYRG